MNTIHDKPSMTNGSKWRRKQRCPARNQLHLRHLRADLRVLIHVMENDKSLYAPKWQIISLKETLADTERGIYEQPSR